MRSDLRLCPTPSRELTLFGQSGRRRGDEYKVLDTVSKGFDSAASGRGLALAGRQLGWIRLGTFPFPFQWPLRFSKLLSYRDPFM